MARVGDVIKVNGSKAIKLSKYEGIFSDGGYVDGISLYDDEIKPTKEKPFKVVSAMRKDTDGSTDYRHYLVKRGRTVYIVAGCRFFYSVKEAVAHWSRPFTEWTDDIFAKDRREFKNEQSLKIIARLVKKMKKLEEK